MKYLLIVTGLITALGGFSWYEKNTTEENTSMQKQNIEERQETQNKTDESYKIDQADFVDAPLLTQSIPSGTLTEAEAAGLAYMREEEKLARDVYQALYEKWGAQIFANITKSEQTHMDAVLTLLERYNITDPAQAEFGDFTNEDLQNLYTKLVTQGSQSIGDAYNVGAFIEDLDIADLEQYISETELPDILVVYENLQRGSRNHLRAFNRQIVRETGESYVPVYISSTMFTDIIGNDTERGPRGGRGRN